MSVSLGPQPSPRLLEWPDILSQIQPILAESPSPVYLVGGAVRDAYLGRRIHDLDFATAEDGRRLAQKVANKLGGAYYPLDDERKVGRAIIVYEGERFVVDVAQFRGGDLAADLTGRDFTMNALAVPLHDETGMLQQIVDPCGGLADLNHKRLRRCSASSIGDDPVRALRAVRQGVALGLLIETDTRHDLRRYGPGIVAASAERVRDEFMNILDGPRPHAALRALDALGLLALVIPEIEDMRGVTQSLPHTFDVWEHTLNVVEKLSEVLHTISPARTSDSAGDVANGMIVYLLDRYRHPLQSHLAVPLPNERTARSLLTLAAVLHDAGKPQTRTVGDDGRLHFYQHEAVGAQMAELRGTALRLSNEEVTRLSGIVRHHMRPMMLRESPELSRRAVHRYWKSTAKVAEAVGVDVCILTQADYLGMVGATFTIQGWIEHLQVVGALLEAYFNQRETVVAPPPLVTGHDLMNALALAPGPQIGHLLDLLGEAQAAGEVSTIEEALALARQHLNPDEK